MAVTLPTTYSSYLHPTTRVPQASLSCASKVFVGLRTQSPNSYGISTPNVDVGLHNRVYRSIESGSRNSKRIRDRIVMMAHGTPMVPYRNPAEGRWQWIDLWNALYRERIVFIGQHIDEEFGNKILATLLYLDTIEDSARLTFYISCPGGDLSPSLALYDTMQSLQSPVATHCMGNATNIAAFILAAGQKGYRTGLPLSRIQIEAPAGAAHGKADDILNEAQELTRIKNYLYKELAEKTGQPIEKINKDLRSKLALKSQAAIEYGILDRVIRPSGIDPSAPKKNESTFGLG